MRDRLDRAGALDRDRGHQRVRARTGHRVVVDVDEADLARILQRFGDREHRLVGAALGRVELDARDPVACAQFAGKLRLFGPLVGGDDELALGGGEGSRRLPFFLDGPRDRCDLGRRRPAAAADHPGPQGAGLRSELREVLRCRVRVDDAAAGKAGKAHVRQRGERPPIAHCLERGERGVQPGAVVGANGGELVRAEPLDRVACRDTSEGLGVLVEGQQRDDRQARDALHGLDRRSQLVEVEEGLDHEQVDPATLEQGGLLGEDRPTLIRREAAELSERPDRAGDIDVPAGDLTRLAGELDAGLVDRRDLVPEELGAELVAVRTKRVGLDQLRAGVDEARVQRDDAFRRADVRLLRTAQAGNGARDEHAHAPVRDHRRPMFKPFFEAIGHCGSEAR